MHWHRLAFLPTVFANVEKVIFKAPAAVTIPQTSPSLDALCLDILTPANTTVATALPLAFPSHQSPRGRESWYLLRGLTEGQRNEVRTCWAATVSLTVCLEEANTKSRKQPTEFWLDTFTFQQTFDTPELITSLADYSEDRAKRGNCNSHVDIGSSTESLAFLRVQAAADFFSSNETLMRHPPDVLVDISASLDSHGLNLS